MSRSAFHRKALWLAAYGLQITQAREIAAVMAEKLGQAPEGDVSALLNDTIRTMVFDLMAGVSLEEADSIKMLKEAAMTLYRLDQSRKLAAGSRREMMAAFEAKASEAVSAVVKARGISAETAEEIKARILGITRT